MTKKEKFLKELLKLNKTEYRFPQIHTVLSELGFICLCAKGSHFTYRKNNIPHILIVVHNRKVKKWYIQNAVKILKKYGLI